MIWMLPMRNADFAPGRARCGACIHRAFFLRFVSTHLSSFLLAATTRTFVVLHRRPIKGRLLRTPRYALFRQRRKENICVSTALLVFVIRFAIAHCAKSNFHPRCFFLQINSPGVSLFAHSNIHEFLLKQIQSQSIAKSSKQSAP